MIPIGCHARMLWTKSAEPLGGGRAQARRGASLGTPKVLMTDAAVLQCWARAEFQGWTLPRCARAYGVSRDYMRRLLSYQTRSKLIPKRSDVGGVA